MNKKLGNKELLIILLLLVGIYGIYRFISNKRGENTFHVNIVPKIDSGKINGMLIYTSTKKGEPMRFMLKDKKWYVTQDGYTTLADDKAGGYAIQQIKQISPDRLATSDPTQWKDYNATDSAGTRLVLLNNTDTLIDVIVGRFGFNAQAKQGISYMRLHGQNEVYGVTGFLALNITQDVDSWRNRRLTSQDYNAWDKLIFTYPGDSSFTVQKDSTHKWHFENGGKTDSIGAAATVNTMSQQNYGKFVYKFDTNSVKPVYTLLIEGKTVYPVLVKVYPSADTATRYVITSSLNPGAYFNEKKSQMLSKLFVGKNAFLHHAEAKKPAAPQAHPAKPAKKK